VPGLRHWPYTIPLRIRSLFFRNRVERELNEEFQFHFDRQVEAGLAQGMTPDEARAAAGRAFGPIPLRNEECRDTRGFNFIDNLAQDLRYAARILRKNPSFTFAVILALSLGIGVNTVAFTLWKAMLARRLDARNPGEMVNLARVPKFGSTGVDFGDISFSYPDYEAYQDSVDSFSGVVAFTTERLRLSNAGGVVSQRTSTAESPLGRFGLLSAGASNAEFASVYVVSENYFKVLGVAALRGRTFDSLTIPELVASPSALIGENYWQRRFARDPAVLGKTIRLNGVAVTVIGITPHDFVGTGVVVPDFWLPVSLEPLIHGYPDWLHSNGIRPYRLFARLAPGASIGQAQSGMTLVARRRRSGSDKPATAFIWPGSPLPLPLNSYHGLKLTILLIMLAAGIVLIVACANVGSLQLARVRSRRNELHTRLSLGASRRRVIRQLLTESALLGLLAGGAALLFTWALMKISLNFFIGALPAEDGAIVLHVTPDLEIFAWVFVISLVAGILFGLAPAMETSRQALAPGAGASTVRFRRFQDFFLGAQVALSLVLTIAGSMFVRGAIHSLGMETGYESKRVISLDFQFPEASKYAASRKAALVRELRARIAVIPGVAAITSARPPDANVFRTAAVSLDKNAQSILHYSYVQANYFETLGVPLLLGRGFQSQAGEPERSIILSESAARQLWPGENPVGHSLRLGVTDEQYHGADELIADGPAYQVIGMVRDIRGFEFDGSDSRQIYLPLSEDGLQDHPLLIRTRSDPAKVIRATDALVSSIDPDMVTTASTLDEMLRQTGPFIASSLAAAIASALGLLGLLLASMGIYGTVGYIVVLRTREVGIRIAVGAQKHNIVGLILCESTRPVIAGLLVGILLAAATSYLLRGLLYGLKAIDGLASFAEMALLFLAIAILAAWIPARRATRVDPVVTLRYE